MKTYIRFFLFFLILILGFTGIAYYMTFVKPLPDYDAHIDLNEINTETNIFWDTFGTPHIYSSNEEDIYFAMGYVHAQDRLWQMTLSQIAAEGRFAEFFGNDSALIALDTYQRTLGFWRTAKKLNREVLSPKETLILEAYSRGVNSYIRRNKNRLPVQFSLADIEPIEWNPTYSIAISRLMAWELNMGWWSEATYGYLESKLDSTLFSELMLGYPDMPPNITGKGAGREATLIPLLELEQQRRELFQIQGTHVGSNAWVVDGSKTESGFPILAGDPHLGLDMPGKWYDIHLNLNNRNVSGASIPGIPAIVIGQNDEMAWTFTSMMADDTDFFLEKMDPDNRGRYISGMINDSTPVYKDFEKIREVIKVKDADDTLIEVRLTEHGPVVSDIYPKPALMKDYLIAMQWSGYEMSNEFRTLYQINWATDFESFKDALQHYGSPGLNFMYADRENNIAMYSVAKLPIRTGNKITFREGWNDENDWQGFIPFEDLPRIINPASGWIANANNKLTNDSYPYYLGTFWEPPSRINRIIQFLSDNQTLSVDDFKILQNDSYSDFASRMVPELIQIIENQQAYNFEQALSYWKNWDFKYDRNSTAASIFDSFLLNYSRNVFSDEMGNSAYENFIHHESIPVRTLQALMQDSSVFFDDISTPVIETRTDMVTMSMQDALLFLSDSLGNEPYEWRWEQLHTLHLRPPLFGRAAEDPEASGALKLIVNNVLSKGPFPVPGHGLSVNNGQYLWNKPFEMVLGPSVRRITDLSDLSKSFSILSTGQSGNPISDYYGDQIGFWLDGEYRSFVQDSALFNTEYRLMKFLPSD